MSRHLLETYWDVRSMLHAVIMAGGSGTRFWPASRRMVPKQLLRLAGPRTMIQSTADRLGDLVPADRRMVVTASPLASAICEQLPELPDDAVVGEPCKRDTAPCIGLAAALIAARDPDGVMLVMPSDHVIGTEQQFRQAVAAGTNLIDRDPTRFVTFGVTPSYPAESFGYIERGEKIEVDASTAYEVIRFREKPDRQTAEGYLAAGSFYWNSGIFLWRAAAILDALQRYEPEMHRHLMAIREALGSPDYGRVLEERFAAIEGKSIDYAVMEKYPNVAVIEAPFRWDDVGSWQALARMHGADAAGNTVQGRHVGIDTQGSIIHGSDDHVIVTIDVQDLIVVQTPDATLVAPKAAEERIREAVRRLESEGLEAFL